MLCPHSIDTFEYVFYPYWQHDNMNDKPLLQLGTQYFPNELLIPIWPFLNHKNILFF